MNTAKRKAIIILFLLFFTLTIVLPASAEIITLDEAALYSGGSAAGIHAAPDGTLFVVDDLTELWKVNPSTGAFVDYFPFGTSNLADIDLAQPGKLWWTNNRTEFGSLDLSTNEIKEWTINITNYGLEPLNLGPVAYYDGKVWLASWANANYGIFSFDPLTRNLCLYNFPAPGLTAADLLAHDGYLWMLDRASDVNDSLLRMDPGTGRLIRYALGRDIREHANLQTDGSLLWWAEDQVGGALVSFNPDSGLMTTFSLPAGTHPRNLSHHAGKVWYTDFTGSFGRLDPELAVNQSASLSASLVAESITPVCEILADTAPYPATIYAQDEFTWADVDSNLDTSQSGLQIYTLPIDAKPYGIAASANAIWISDAGRQKLIRMPIDQQQAYITVVKNVINDNGGTAVPNDFLLTLESASVTSGVAVPVNPGTYTAGETLLPGYTFTGFSGDCDSNGDVTIALGESKTCTLTNNDQGADFHIYLPLILK